MIGFQSSILAGTVLMRDAIQSPNYLTNVSGWTINQDGSVEFNNAVIRGSISAGGGTVVLNNGGLQIIGPLLKYDINTGAGFIVRRVPDDGSSVAMTATSTTMGIFMNPAQPTPVNGTIWSAQGRMVSDYVVTGSSDQSRLEFIPAFPTGKGVSRISMLSQGSGSSGDDSKITLSAASVAIISGISPLLGPSLIVDGNDIGRGYHTGDSMTTSSAAIGATETAVLATPVKDFKPGRVYRVVVTGGVTASVANNTPLFRCRKDNGSTPPSGQQFDAWRVPCINTSSHPASYTCYFKVGATTVNASILITLTGSAGFNAVLTGAATSPATLNIYDDGDASLRPNVATLV